MAMIKCPFCGENIPIPTDEWELDYNFGREINTVVRITDDFIRLETVFSCPECDRHITAHCYYQKATTDINGGPVGIMDTVGNELFYEVE